MNNTFTSQQISQTGNLDFNLIMRRYNFHLIARFGEINSMKPKLTQKETAKELGYSTSSLQCYGQDIYLLSPYRIPTKSYKRKQKISNREHDLERPQMTSKEINRPQESPLQ